MSERPIFLRPIHFNPTAADHFTVNSTVVDLTEGVYGDIRMLLYILGVLSAVQAAGFTITLGDDYKITLAATSIFTFDFGETATRDLLGFTSSSLSGAATYTATHTPSHLWLPSYGQVNQEEFRLRHQDRFVGRTAIDGGISGIKLDGGDIYFKDLSFQFEPNYNVMGVFARSAYDKARNFDSFLDGIRWDIPDSPDAVAITGFYYFPDHTNAQSIVVNPDSLSGTDFNYTTSPDTHVFCNVVPESIQTPRVAVPVGQELWNVTFSINTATPPGWVTLV